MADGAYTTSHPALASRSQRSVSSKYMKNRSSKPPTYANASRRSIRQAPESQPAVPSRGVPRSRRYAAVHGFEGHTQPNTAWPTPRPIDGSSRAEG